MPLVKLTQTRKIQGTLRYPGYVFNETVSNAAARVGRKEAVYVEAEEQQIEVLEEAQIDEPKPEEKPKAKKKKVDGEG